MPASVLSRGVRAYIGAVAIAGSAVILHSLYGLYAHSIGYTWLMLAALTLLSNYFTLSVPSVRATISISEAFVLASVLLFGPDPAVITVAVDGLIISIWSRQRKLYHGLFNTTEPAVSVWGGAKVFSLLVGDNPLVTYASDLSVVIWPLMLAALVYFLLNSGLTAIVIALESKTSPVRIWRENFVWFSLNYIGGASVAMVLVQNARGLNVHQLGIVVPLLVILYLTFKVSADRLADAKQHVTHVNKLYLSTVETLAMAVDAKDQVTHGHIRRVQAYALAVAKALGIKDEAELRAIEAAALLHDMGKLAIPEHILNKPGRLTDVEFDRMKMHASIGAEIISAIDFPYPVVPIVRHHHEQWNGKGYPTGISGTDIPIGARILSVVDCFDALTSDRPYRRALSDEQAMNIVKEGSGTMYDPWVVEKFAEIYPTMAQQPGDTSTPHKVFRAIARTAGATEPRVLAARAGGALAADDGMFDVHELCTAASQETTLAGIAAVVAERVRRVIPDSITALYLYENANDELVLDQLVGARSVDGGALRIPLGQRLAGWVGANRSTLVNADPALDGVEALAALDPTPRSCLSTPLLVDEILVGVLTIYAPSDDSFTGEHQHAIERVAPTIANATWRIAQSRRQLAGSLTVH